MEFQILECTHQHLHSLLNHINQFSILMNLMSFMRPKKSTGLTNTDLTVNTIKLPWLSMFQADFLRLRQICSLGPRNYNLRVVLAHLSVARVEVAILDEGGMVALGRAKVRIIVNGGDAAATVSAFYQVLDVSLAAL